MFENQFNFVFQCNDTSSQLKISILNFQWFSIQVPYNNLLASRSIFLKMWQHWCLRKKSFHFAPKCLYSPTLQSCPSTMCWNSFPWEEACRGTINIPNTLLLLCLWYERWLNKILIVFQWLENKNETYTLNPLTIRKNIAYNSSEIDSVLQFCYSQTRIWSKILWFFVNYVFFREKYLHCNLLYLQFNKCK